MKEEFKWTGLVMVISRSSNRNSNNRSMLNLAIMFCYAFELTNNSMKLRSDIFNLVLTVMFLRFFDGNNHPWWHFWIRFRFKTQLICHQNSFHYKIMEFQKRSKVLTLEKSKIRHFKNFRNFVSQLWNHLESCFVTTITETMSVKRFLMSTEKT